MQVDKYLKQTREKWTNFASKNPHLDFYAGQFTCDIVFRKSRHAKSIHDLKMMGVALIFPRVDEVGSAHWGKLKKYQEATLSIKIQYTAL